MSNVETFSRAEEQSVQLPEKLQNTGEYKNNSNQYPVFLNAYNVNINNVVDVVYKHELKFQAYFPLAKLQSGKEIPEKLKDLWKGPRNDVSNHLRQRLNYFLFKKLIELNSQFFGSWDPSHRLPIHGYAYDCSTILYCIKPLVESNEFKEFWIDRNESTNDLINNVVANSDRITKFKCVISGFDQLKIKDCLANQTESRDHSVFQFLDILFNQYVYQKDTYFLFPIKMFKRQDEIKLQDEPRVLRSGMQKNVRIVGDEKSSVRPILQIDSKKAAFYPKVCLVEFVKNLISRANDDPRYDFIARIYEGNSLATVNKHLKGLCVEANHMKSKHIILISGITEKSAEAITFEFQGRKTSVVEYFEKVYTIKLKYPKLPCVVEKKIGLKTGTNHAFFPFEVLSICDGQRVSFDKQTPKLVEQMIRNCQARPNQFRDNTNMQKSDAFLANSNPFIKAFKVTISNEIDKAQANILHPPKIKYNDRTFFEIENSDPSWKQFVVKFLNPAKVGRWVFCALLRCLPDKQLNDFAELYVNVAKQHGMDIDRPTHFQRFASDNILELREFMRVCQTNGVRFLICITKDKLDPYHNLLKFCEIEYGIVTQHIWAENVRKSVENPNRKMTLINIIMKSNLKLGGVNYDLHTSQSFARVNPRITHDIVNKEWLRDSRMFIGLDFSHAPPQTLYERQAKIPCTDPTVVGLSYTVNSSLKMLGKYFYQEPRITYAQNLKVNLVDALLKYQEEQHSFPQHIIMYRSGASEGEYRIAITYERKAFEEAFEILKKDYMMTKKPYVTIIIVQRNSNYRFVPQNAKGDKPFLQNVPSGTCIDKDVMSPNQTEFFLIGHKTIQGTARGIRCTVIWDDHIPRIKLEELEYVTYCLCFAHGIVCSPTSVPSVLYSASDLAKRGRNNYKASLDYNADKKIRDSNDLSYFEKMTTDLQNAIKTKYWA